MILSVVSRVGYFVVGFACNVCVVLHGLCLCSMLLETCFDWLMVGFLWF